MTNHFFIVIFSKLQNLLSNPTIRSLLEEFVLTMFPMDVAQLAYKPGHTAGSYDNWPTAQPKVSLSDQVSDVKSRDDCCRKRSVLKIFE